MTDDLKDAMLSLRKHWGTAQAPGPSAKASKPKALTRAKAKPAPAPAAAFIPEIVGDEGENGIKKKT